MERGNDLQAGSFNSQITSPSQVSGKNTRSLHASMYVWKQTLSTGGRQMRTSTDLVQKYKLGLSYSMETIAAQIGHTRTYTNSGTLALSGITSMRLINATPMPKYRIGQRSILSAISSRVPSAAACLTMTTCRKVLMYAENNLCPCISSARSSNDGTSTHARTTVRIKEIRVRWRIGFRSSEDKRKQSGN